jgi:CubicO group peptidase (beta-lactamase class C family)
MTMEKQQFRVLYRQFLFRLIDLDLLSSDAQGDSNKLLGQFASLLIFVSVILSLGAAGSQRTDIAKLVSTWSMEHLMIATTMLVVGIFAVLSWDSTFPNRSDVLVLAPLPVRPRTLFLAKLAASGAAMCLTIACLNALAGFVWPVNLNTQDRPEMDVPALTLLPAQAPASTAELDGLLKRELAPSIPPGIGISIGVVKHGEHRALAYGAAKPDSIYRIGSVTKTFTALLLAQMTVEGRVALDEAVRNLLPSGVAKKPAGPEITLVNLATHRSGLPPIPPNLNPQHFANREIGYRARELWAALSKAGVARLASPPPIYSNFGYGVLGEALARRAGTTFPELLSAKIAAPLGLRDTVFDLTEQQEMSMLPGFSGDGRPQRAWYLDALNGAAGLHSTAPDMLTYLEANLHADTPAFKLQHGLRAAMGPRGMFVALGWMYDADTGTYFHNGVIQGYTAHALFHPKDDYAVVVLMNQAPSLVVFADVVAHHIQQRLTGKPAIALHNMRVPGNGGLLDWLRVFAVYWFAMFAAGGWIFCCVLGLQGVAAQLLPRRVFLRASSFLQMAAFCAIVSVYFIQPLFVTGESLIAINGDALLSWSPSYWFLGLFQQCSGSPAMAPLARRAWIGLAIAIGVTAVTYALSYFRTLRQIVEAPDIVPGARRIGWLPPFGFRLQTALAHFTIRTLARSRQHRIVLAFYLGIGFALTIMLLKAPTADNRLPDAPASNVGSERIAPLLAASIIMLCFAAIGARVVFAMPKDLRANWIFRVCGIDHRPVPWIHSAERRALIALSAAPVLFATTVIAFRHWPIQAAIGHLCVLILLASILTDVCLYNFHKVPFTCSYLPGKSRVHMAMLGAAGLLWIVLFSVRYEREALEDPIAMMPMLGGLFAVALAARRLAAHSADGAQLRFEEEDDAAVQVLGLR